MTNKVKKRQISELDVAEDSGNVNYIKLETKKGVKKAKMDLNTVSIKMKETPTAMSPRKSKKLKNKKINNGNLGFQVSDAMNVKSNEAKVVDENAVMKKKLKREKAKQLKKEKRKQLRKEHGQYKMVGTMTDEVMRQRIEEIQNRDNLTKTAKRKLRILKKKLSIAEGTALIPQKVQAGEENTTKLTGQKKKLSREKLKSQNLLKNQNDSMNISKELKQDVAKKLLVQKTEKIAIKTEKKSLEESNERSKGIKVECKEETMEEACQSIQKKVPIKIGLNDTSEEENDEEEGSDGGSSEKSMEDNTIKKSQVQRERSEPNGKRNILAAKISCQENEDKKKRYVLFVGNIPFKATTEDIKQHFLQKVSEVSSVRIPTDKQTEKPRGFAYVEVMNNVDYEKALSLHQTILKGFKINVEYTQTGSKKIRNKQKVVAKNKKLHAIRKAGKLAGSKKENGQRSFRRNLKKKLQDQSMKNL